MNGEKSFWPEFSGLEALVIYKREIYKRATPKASSHWLYHYNIIAFIRSLVKGGYYWWYHRYRIIISTIRDDQLFEISKIDHVKMSVSKDRT